MTFLSWFLVFRINRTFSRGFLSFNCAMSRQLTHHLGLQLCAAWELFVAWKLCFAGCLCNAGWVRTARWLFIAVWLSIAGWLSTAEQLSITGRLLVTLPSALRSCRFLFGHHGYRAFAIRILVIEEAGSAVIATSKQVEEWESHSPHYILMEILLKQKRNEKVKGKLTLDIVCKCTEVSTEVSAQREKCQKHFISTEILVKVLKTFTAVADRIVLRKRPNALALSYFVLMPWDMLYRQGTSTKCVRTLSRVGQATNCYTFGVSGGWFSLITFALSSLNGACAHYVMVSKFQWKPFWLATQRDPPNNWTANQNCVYCVNCEKRIRTDPMAWPEQVCKIISLLHIISWASMSLLFSPVNLLRYQSFLSNYE